MQRQARGACQAMSDFWQIKQEEMIGIPFSAWLATPILRQCRRYVL